MLRSGLDTNVFHPDAALLYIKKEKCTESVLKRQSSASTLIETQSNIDVKEIKSVVGHADHMIKDIRKLAGAGANNGPILIYAGRLAIEKSIDFLIRAMGHPLLLDATLVIVGDGPIRPELEIQAKQTVGANSIFSTNYV